MLVLILCNKIKNNNMRYYLLCISLNFDTFFTFTNEKKHNYIVILKFYTIFVP